MDNEGERLANIRVQVLDASDRPVGRPAAVFARPHHTFTRVMMQTCEQLGVDLDDYDVWSGNLMLNGNTDEIRTFGIPVGQWLQVTMKRKWIDDCF